MDQAHANGIGEWDPNNFGGETWDHHQFGGQALGFDPNHGHDPDNTYHTHTPDPFIGTSSQINPQLSAPDSQPSLYRQFDFYPPPADAWSAPAPTNAPYGHEPSLAEPYYASQHQPVDASRTVDSRFALVDPPQGDDYQDHHIPVQETQEALSHGFGGHVVHGTNQAPDNFIQENVHSWGQRIATPPAGYLPNREYENPLAPSQAVNQVNLPNQGPRGSPSSYPSVHGSVPSAVQHFQVNAHQPAETRQFQQQYVLPQNGQPVQGRPSVAQPPVPRNTGSPRVVSQPATQEVAVPQLQQQSQPQPQSVPQLLSKQLPPQKIPFTQPQVVQQQSAPSVPSPEKNSASGVKRRPVSEVQDSKVVAKKAKVLAGPANTGSPAAGGSQPDASSSNTPFFVDNEILSEAYGCDNCMWPGVPNLAIGEVPVKLKKGPPTKRYVIIAAKGGKDPLLPALPRGWTPAESLGNHADAYQNAKSDLDRQRADARLEIEMKRGGNEIPSDWWKKVPRGDSATEAKRMDIPPEPINTTIKASESLRIHPAHKSNRKLLLQVFDDYYPLILEKATELKNAPALEKLGKAVKSRAKNPASFGNAEFEALRQELEPLRKQLEAAIVEGLKNGDPRILKKIGEKSSVPIRLLNILINLINIGDSNSSLAKVILRLFGSFTSVKRSQLEQWKFPSTKAKLEVQGDAEVKELIAIIFANAEKNDDKDAGDAKTSEVKRVTKVANRVSSSSSGSKRAREDDANGDLRSSKKAATDSKPISSAASNGKTPATGTKASAAAVPIKAPTSKLSATAPATGTTIVQPKVRTGLLLPGKSRPVPKPVAKPEPLKADGQKTLSKSDTISKVQPVITKIEPPKPALSKPLAPASTAGTNKPKASDASQPSKFASLLAEIAEPKKVVAPTPPPLIAPDPNETEQEKVRRLRKEERRRLGLRVAFKSEDRLVEIREFTRHPEEMGRAGSVRDVKSDNKDKMEGMALKKGHAGEIRPWEEPIAVDFDDLPADKREQTYITRGGTKTFATEQQKFMEDREAKELMVIYTDPSDIPPTPKSPPYEPVLMYDDPSNGPDVRLPQTPEFAEVHHRMLDQAQQGFWRTVYAAQARLESQANPDYADFTKVLKSVSSIAESYNGYQTAPVTQSRNADARSETDPAKVEFRQQQVYQLLQSDRVKNFKELDPYDPARPKTRAADYVEDIVEQFRQSGLLISKQEVATPAAVVASQPVPQPAQDYSAAWAQYYAQQAHQGQQPSQQQQQWYAQQQPAAYVQSANPYLQAQTSQAPNLQQGADLSAILSALGNQQQAQQQVPAATDPAQVQALMAALGQPQGDQAAIAGLTGVGAPQDPQQAEYLMSLMKWAQQGGSSAPAATSAPTATAPYIGGAYPYGGLHPDRDRELRERDGYRDNNNNGKDRDHDNHHHNSNRGGVKNKNRDRDRDADGSGGDNVPEHLRGINRSLIGTKQCSFWARGQCAKGDKCTFRHD
ncbi:hypothetical protein B0H66DRAFT_471523 [Apodospora peruviana]|uniref:C3H1-type domain-containing protein n=1 Tax=Apodospora peruviana TaxID=516989 RepID=A0AAE0IK23_9PEZI|nr:hypothetical protein B0H66DRAFT_471523 [Apodospora peruviana]